MTDNIFPVLPIEDLINKDGNPTTPHKLTTSTKPLVSHLRVLFYPCVVRKSMAHKSLTSDTTFSNYLLIVDAYSKIPKLYGMDNITTEEVMDELDICSSTDSEKWTNLDGGI